jgi:hypothetical protein
VETEANFPTLTELEQESGVRLQAVTARSGKVYIGLYLPDDEMPAALIDYTGAMDLTAELIKLADAVNAANLATEQADADHRETFGGAPSLKGLV